MDLQFSPAELKAVLPATILFATGLVVLITDLFVTGPDGNDEPTTGKSHLVFLGLCGAVLALAALFMSDGLLSNFKSGTKIFSGAIMADAFGGYCAALIIVALLLTTVACGGYLGAQGQNRGEYYGLLYMGAGAMVLLAQASNLISIFVALETMSFSVYVLSGFFRKWKTGSEGAFKYFVMGAFSSGFLLFGMALIYGATGSIELSAIRSPGVDAVLLNVGLLLLLVGFAFKVGAVPFHSWVPDAYQGAPAMSAGWMAVAVKICSFAALFRVVLATRGDEILATTDSLGQLLAAIAVVTMILGNLAALNQTNVKRMLAYSGIGHTGYLLIPVVLSYSGTPDRAGTSALFYFAAYIFMTLGAFIAIAAISSGKSDREELRQLSGLGKRHPFVALVFTISLLSLAGIPGTAGFWGKLMIFRNALQSQQYAYLAVIGVLASIVSVYYYLRPVVAMYFEDTPADEAPVELVGDAWGLKLALALSVIGTLGLFVFGKPLHQLSEQSLRSIAG
ncbi:MAG: NADH-quinone oxidoreductase subunit N [Planctomycetota bacterium]